MKLHPLNSIILLILLSTGQIWGQGNLKYREVIEVVNSKPINEYLPYLQAFQEQNVQNANVYYQMGKAYHKLLSTYDPIPDQTKVKLALYNVKLYMGLCRRFIDSKDPNRNPEYYDLKDSKSDLYPEALKLIAATVAEDSTYSTDFLELIYHYDKSVSYYDSCLFYYKKVNERDRNLRSLYLKADDQLTDEIEKVGKMFDSVQVHFAQYAQKLSILKKQEAPILVLNPITFYRMNGLSSTSLMLNKVEAWDYGTWSKRFLYQLSTEVDLMRKEIANTLERSKSVISKLYKLEPGNALKDDSLVINPKIYSLIRKYDSNSGLLEYFSFLDTEIKYLNLASQQRNFPENSQTEFIEDLSAYARYYSNISALYKKADSAILTLEKLKFQSQFSSFASFVKKDLPDSLSL